MKQKTLIIGGILLLSTLISAGSFVIVQKFNNPQSPETETSSLSSEAEGDASRLDTSPPSTEGGNTETEEGALESSIRTTSGSDTESSTVGSSDGRNNTNGTIATASETTFTNTPSYSEITVPESAAYDVTEINAAAYSPAGGATEGTGLASGLSGSVGIIDRDTTPMQTALEIEATMANLFTSIIETIDGVGVAYANECDESEPILSPTLKDTREEHAGNLFETYVLIGQLQNIQLRYERETDPLTLMSIYEEYQVLEGTPHALHSFEDIFALEQYRETTLQPQFNELISIAQSEGCSYNP